MISIKADFILARIIITFASLITGVLISYWAGHIPVNVFASRFRLLLAESSANDR